MSKLTPPAPKGYFYAVVPVERYDFSESPTPEQSNGVKLQLRRRRPFWFSALVATVFVKADKHVHQVSIKSLDKAAAELNQILLDRTNQADSYTKIKNVVKETNQRA